MFAGTDPNARRIWLASPKHLLPRKTLQQVVALVRGGTGGAANCLRMAPPLTVTDDEIDLAAEILDSSLAAVGSAAHA